MYCLAQLAANYLWQAYKLCMLCPRASVIYQQGICYKYL